LSRHWAKSRLFESSKVLPQAGFDMSLGGALAYLSSSNSSSPDLNLVNDWDPGRLVQQTYYGSPDNSSWVQWGKRVQWRYNPVQVRVHLGGRQRGGAAPRMHLRHACSRS
jgi:hypothetical protein